MDFYLFAGTVGAVILGGGLLVAFFYAIFWGDLQIKRGLLAEDRLPWWWYVCTILPPLIGGTCIYVSVTIH